jgi:hypothetical protein
MFIRRPSTKSGTPPGRNGRPLHDFARPRSTLPHSSKHQLEQQQVQTASITSRVSQQPIINQKKDVTTPASKVPPPIPPILHALHPPNSFCDRPSTTTPTSKRTRRIRTSAKILHRCIQHSKANSYHKSHGRGHTSVETTTSNKSIASL